MEFNIRAMSLAECVDSSSRVDVNDFVGKQVEFRAGITISARLPETPAGFALLPEPELVLLAVVGWTRVFRYPVEDGEAIHVLAPAQMEDEELHFYRIDLRQPPASRRGRPKPAVEITGGAIMTYAECAGWLVNLALGLAKDRDRAQLHVKLARPRLLRPKQLRLACIGPHIVDGTAMPERLEAIGKVHGADILCIPIRTYRDVAARLAGALPLDTVIVCGHFAPHITFDAVPADVPRDLVHLCQSPEVAGLEDQVRAWIEIADAEVQKQAERRAADEEEVLLTIMLRGMISHSKIGQFSHCQKETVLTGVRARHLNASVAAGIVDANSEAFQDTKESTALFLWKDHNDGRQYFLNPMRIEQIKARLAAHTG